jgi:ArsR family transcriptional regulator, cadmium/lead-responsive transcriptional repressor
MPRGAIDTEELVAAVTEPTRRQMLDLLLERGESTATALADSLPITRQAVSKHLAVLTRVGLVAGEKSGREMRYRLNVERLDRATRSLGELAATWDQRLMRIKQIARRQPPSIRRNRGWRPLQSVASDRTEHPLRSGRRRNQRPSSRRSTLE